MTQTSSLEDARRLPPAGFERKAFYGLAALVLVMKALAILHYRVDSDETQHAHIVWGWATGQLPYRDLFDNHMELFQMLCAPLFRLLGETPYIIPELRVAILPIFGLCLWAVYSLAETLFSRRIAPWAALAAAAMPLFFYTSTEFRPDDLWAAFWLLALAVAARGRFTVGRAAAFGLMVGLAAAVSLKTVVLVAALLTATIIAMAYALARGWRTGIMGSGVRLLVILAVGVIPPAALVFYFWRQGALPIMRYCVIDHNMVPGLKRWGHFSLHFWDFPLGVACMAAYAGLIFHQTRDTGLAIRRTFVLLTPFLYLALLLSYWPDLTREDNLPDTPLLPLALAPVFILLDSLVRSAERRRRFLSYGLPALCFAELLWTWNANPLRNDRVKGTTEGLRDVLRLTHPGEMVMDAKGDYIFRPRPYYWVIETVTRARIRMGLIRDRLQDKLVQYSPRVCYLYAAHLLPDASLFVVSNYMPFDPLALDVGVLGKVLPNPAPDGTFSFEVAIPGRYAVVSESGDTQGTLDGTPYSGPVELNAGHHTFHRTGGSGRAAIFLDRAAAAGFHPLFNQSLKMIAAEHARNK
ncbi:MAG TPA: glycosyltransferase family 39 protein [Chthoniobacteraceae bacterium]|nr:glycosyltransferase family 39 protein [Chthoniobacteraceae bacterium]